MKIRCANCGRSMTVPDADAGRTVMCNACGQRMIIPMPVIPLQEQPPTANRPVPVKPQSPAQPPSVPAADPRFWGTQRPPPQQMPAARPAPTRPVFRQAEPEPTGMSPEAKIGWILLGLLCVAAIAIATFLATVAQRRSMPAAPAVATPASPAAPTPAASRATPTLVPPSVPGAPAQASATPVPWDPSVRSLVLTGVKLANQRAGEGRLADAHQLYTAVERAASTQPTADSDMQTVLQLARTDHEEVVKKLSVQALTDAARRQAAQAPPRPPATSSTAAREPPGPLHVTKPEPTGAALSDAKIGDSIRRGVNWLVGQFDPATHQLRGPTGNRKSGGQHNGLDALCVYALLQAGEADLEDERLDPRRPVMAGMLDALDKLEMEEGCETYGRALRASALGLANRKEDRATLQADMAWLLSTHKNGAYSYGNPPASKGGSWDNSNTQYGQLGVWAGQDAGVDVQSSYWIAVQRHWTDNQNDDGTWSYHGANTGWVGGGPLSMTCAGLASLFVAQDRIGQNEDTAARIGRAPFPPALAKALAWFEAGDNAVGARNYGWWGYALYGVERVGLASGMKFFGTHDWYAELAGRVVAQQSESGSWGDEQNTAYVLLFLSRGRHPILMNKLRFDGAWANRPRDLANLTHYAAKELERQLNWQVVSVNKDFESWTDSPILYLASHEAVHLTNVQLGQIRRFVDAGGLLFTHADGGAPAFNDYAAELATKLFPELGDKPLRPLPVDHEIYSLLYRPQPPPPLEGVSNGVRLLMLHSPMDLSVAWQHGVAKSHPAEFQFGVNLFLYAAGKGQLRNRLASPIVPPPPPATGGRTALARLRYGPKDDETVWNPEPAAWPRFASWFTWQTSCAVDVSPIAFDELKPGVAPIAHLTGVKSFDFSDADAKAIREYVDGGGTLLIDCAGGSAAFADSATRLIGRAFPDRPLRPLPLSHPLFAPTVDGMEDLTQPLLRPYALRKLGPKAGNTAVESLSHGKGRVLYTGLDLTAGLLGTRMWGILGFEPAYAEAWVKNAVLWTAAGSPDKPRAAEAR